MTDEQTHENVGSYLMEYCHAKGGSQTRFSFYIKAGDDPNWWLAQRLMPGAVNLGKIGAIFECDGAINSRLNGEFYDCELRVRGSVFHTQIWAEDLFNLCDRLDEIGGLAHRGYMPVPRWKLFLRYYWLRRPTIRRRSPLDIFERR